MNPDSKQPLARKPHSLAGYLAGAIGSAAVLTAPQAEAAVTAVTFGFGSEFTPSDGFNDFWSVGPGFGTMSAGNGGSYLTIGYRLDAGLGSFYENDSRSTYRGVPSFFPSGTVIGAGGNGNQGYTYFRNDSFPSLNFPTDQLNKNIGFITSTHNWGWANVSWFKATSTLQINSAFVESVPNMPITISVSSAPEPSRALLALAGLAGVALRRRR